MLPTYTSNDASPSLFVSDLNVTYENSKSGELTHAVDGVTLLVQPGEFVTIVGLSGCGKSTFLSTIAGLVTYQSGTIEVDGIPISGPGFDRSVVFQKPSLLPWRTVLENVVYGLEIHGLPKRLAAQKAQKFIELVQLGGFEAYHPHELSGGMQQRVNLARALVTEPKILLLDEPFAALDAITRDAMQNELLAIWETTKKSVLMVTHQIDEAVLLSDRVVVFSQRPAKIVQEVKIDLPRVRTPEIKNDEYFHFLVNKIGTLIHQSSLSTKEVEFAI